MTINPLLKTKIDLLCASKRGTLKLYFHPETDSRKTSQLAEETGQHAKETGQRAKETGQCAKETGQHAKETSQLAVETGSARRELASQSVNEMCTRLEHNLDGATVHHDILYT